MMMRRFTGLAAPLATSRLCSSTTTTTTTTTTTAGADNGAPTNPDWKPPTGKDRLKATTNVASVIDANTKEGDFKPISNSLLYRKLLKLYIKKFDTDVETIVRSWKQTKYEFYTNAAVRQPNLTQEDFEALNIRGQQIHLAILSGVVPIVQNKEGETYARYDAETIRAAHHQIDPVDAEEYLRRHHDRLSPEERDEIRDRLKACGRWKGPDTFSENDVSKMKVRRKNLMKTTCGPEEPASGDAADGGEAGASATRVSTPVTVAPNNDKPLV